VEKQLMDRIYRINKNKIETSLAFVNPVNPVYSGFELFG
jgi:hypothetical protein